MPQKLRLAPDLKETITCQTPRARPLPKVRIYAGNESVEIQKNADNDMLTYTVKTLQKKHNFKDMKCCYYWLDSDPVCSLSHQINMSRKCTC